jgi:hypothetical protein
LCYDQAVIYLYFELVVTFLNSVSDLYFFRLACKMGYISVNNIETKNCHVYL